DLWCWGYNARNEPGNRTVTTAPARIDLGSLNGHVASIALGGHTCVLTVEGGMRCWGANFFGQVGDGTTEQRATPVDVVGLQAGVRAIAVGTWHTCALTIAGAVKCWGGNNHGQLGIGSTINVAVPTDVPGLGSGVVAISAAYDNTCAITGSGR